MSSSMSRQECFRILDLPLGATSDEIKQAYRTKALACHPDKNLDDPEATARFQKISQAYHVLKREFESSNDDSDSDGDEGFSFMDFFMRTFQREIFLAELLRQEELRRRRAMMMEEEMLRNIFGGLFFQPRGRAYYEDDFMDEFEYRPRYRRSEPQERSSARPQTGHSYTDRGYRWSQSRPQVHTPNRQSPRHGNRAARGTSPPCYTPHQPHQPRRSEPWWDRASTTRADSGAATPRTHSSNTAGEQSCSYRSFKSEQESAEETRSANPFTEATKSTGAKETLQGQKPTKAPAYVATKPVQMTKKQLLAQQNRRQREANAIGRELRQKAKANQKLQS